MDRATYVAFICGALCVLPVKAQSDQPSQYTDSSRSESDTPPGEILPDAGDKPALDDNQDVQGQPPTEFNQQLRLDQTDRRNWLGITPENDPLSPWMRLLGGLKENTGLTFGGAYTMLLQQASGGPGNRTAAAGDIDLLLSWKRQFSQTDYIRLNSSFEYRFQIGSITPAQLGPEVGTLIPTTNGFNERPPVVKELFYDQTLLDGRLRWIFGRIDPENYVGGHRLQSANTFSSTRHSPPTPPSPTRASVSAPAPRSNPSSGSTSSPAAPTSMPASPALDSTLPSAPVRSSPSPKSAASPIGTDMAAGASVSASGAPTPVPSRTGSPIRAFHSRSIRNSAQSPRSSSAPPTPMQPSPTSAISTKAASASRASPASRTTTPASRLRTRRPPPAAPKPSSKSSSASRSLSDPNSLSAHNSFSTPATLRTPKRLVSLSADSEFRSSLPFNTG